MIRKRLDEITITDLQYLVENNVQERRTLEYKAALPDNSDSDKKEFLADISSLANAEGGDLIFGLSEKSGILEKDMGVDVGNTDAEIARLENIARDGISPRIALDIRAIAVENRYVIVIRTKASMEAPHRVIYKGSDKFYKRNSNGKYAMDVTELRSAFLQSGELTERIRRFRISRIADIKAGDTPATIPDPSTFIAIHIVPLTAFTTSSRISPQMLQSFKAGNNNHLFRPLRASGWTPRINLDGIMVYAPDTDGHNISYTQLCRDGKIEAVDAFTLSPSRPGASNNINMTYIERTTLEYSSKMIQLLSLLEIQPPFYIFLTLVGVQKRAIQTPSRYLLDTQPIIQKELLLPEVVIDSVSDALESKFKPIFDMVWNASGISQSPNFDEAGNLKDND